MSGAELAFAASLLVVMPCTPCPDIDREEWPNVQAAVWTIAINWELMDPRETNFLFNRYEDMKSDLEILRKRHQDLKGALPVADSRRFPERTAVNDMISFNRALRNHIDSRQYIETDRGDMYRTMLRETDDLYKVWDSIRDARCESFYVTTRRLALERLRDQIGAESYYAGKLPPYVPTWRFQEKD